MMIVVRQFVRATATTNMTSKIKNWFFKNLAAEILKQNPKIEVSEEKKRQPISAFESNDAWLDKQQQAEDEEAGRGG